MTQNPTGQQLSKLDMMSDLSLRMRLVLIVLLLLVVALAVSGSATVAVLRGQLVQQVESELRSLPVDVVKNQNSLRAVDTIRYDLQFYQWADSDEVSWKRPPIWRSESSRRFELSEPDIRQLRGDPFEVKRSSVVMLQRGAGQSGRTVVESFQTVPSIGNVGHSWRVLIRAQKCGESLCADLVALPLDSVDSTISAMVRNLVLLALSVLAVCAAAGLIALRGAFSPLREVETVTAAFAAGDTSQRVAQRPPHTEVGRLGGAVNLMLEKIETTLEQREASEAKMRQFVADASHELRTPLVSVRGYAELYRQGAVQDDTSIARSFERIEQEAIRMGGLVEDMLLLARLDEQRPLQLERVNITAIARDLIQDGTTLAPDRAFRLIPQSNASGNEDIFAIVDEGRFRQVATNLVVNAVRHTPKGTPIDVQVLAEATDTVQLRVIDHGHGIPADQAEKIFERFFRSDDSRQRGEGGGSGLGLAIVASIVNAHHGHVNVTPTPGGGATFTVTIPHKPPGYTQSNSQDSFS